LLRHVTDMMLREQSPYAGLKDKEERAGVRLRVVNEGRLS
jgi:hypothetical protein